MADSRPEIQTLEIAALVKELNAASRRLRTLSRAQTQAALAAEPLAESLSKIAAAVEAAGMAHLGLVADAGRGALDSVEASRAAAFSAPAWERCLGRLRQITRDIRRDIVLCVAAKQGFSPKRRAGPPIIKPQSFVPATDENLLAAREEMNAARNKALDAAKLLPMDALALRVQRLAAIAQDENTRRIDLSPLSSAWLAVPVLSAQMARDLGKQIRIDVMGEEIFVERRLIPVLAICVEQLVRSAAEHSLELAARRGLSRKPASGAITLMAACDQMGFSMTVADDGSGQPDAASLEFVKACMAGLGGGVEVVSVPDWGSSVTLAIPALALGAWRLQAAPRERPPSRQMHAASMAGAILHQAVKSKAARL